MQFESRGTCGELGVDIVQRNGFMRRAILQSRHVGKTFWKNAYRLKPP